MKHLDAARFERQAGGSPALMVRVAKAFVGQLPAWRTELTAAAPHPDKLANLLHKMKGSCYAITATEAAEIFSRAEQALQSLGRQPDAGLIDLLALVAEIEADLHALIQQHDSAAP